MCWTDRTASLTPRHVSCQVLVVVVPLELWVQERARGLCIRFIKTARTSSLQFSTISSFSWWFYLLVLPVWEKKITMNVITNCFMPWRFNSFPACPDFTQTCFCSVTVKDAMTEAEAGLGRRNPIKASIHPRSQLYSSQVCINWDLFVFIPVQINGKGEAAPPSHKITNNNSLLHPPKKLIKKCFLICARVAVHCSCHSN